MGMPEKPASLSKWGGFVLPLICSGQVLYTSCIEALQQRINLVVTTEVVGRLIVCERATQRGHLLVDQFMQFGDRLKEVGVHRNGSSLNITPGACRYEGGSYPLNAINRVIDSVNPVLVYLIHRLVPGLVSGFPDVVGRRRPRHANPEASQIRIRETAIAGCTLPLIVP
jgi:hypothetical protein